MSEPTLVIDDDPSFNTILVRTLERRGHPARGALDVTSALAAAHEMQASRVVLDLNLNGSSGLALIPQLLAINPECRIVVLTGYASIATAVDAIKLGAIHYLAKPCDADEIVVALNKSGGGDSAIEAACALGDVGTNVVTLSYRGENVVRADWVKSYPARAVSESPSICGKL